MKSTRITIVRHGETEMNVAMQLQGHLDSPLTKKGLQQAKLLSEAIKNKKFDVFYSSDLGRAIYTANTINKYLKFNIIESENHRERAFGVMEGLYLNEAKKKYPEVHEAYITRHPTFQIPNGESLTEFSVRIITEFNKLAKTNSGKHILLVAHGGVLDCVIRKIFNLKPEETRSFTILNTSVNTITINDDKWILEEWGNVEHLQDEAVLNEIN